MTARPAFPVQINRASMQADGLIGWWTLVAGAGAASVRDMSERGADSVSHSGTHLNDSVFGRVAAYATQFSLLPTVNGMMTATVWVYQTGTGGNQCPFGLFGSGSDKSWWFNLSGGNCAGWTSSNGSAQSSFGSGAVSTNAWHHLAMVVAGGTGTLYVNGVPKGSNAASNRNATTSNALALGRLGALSTDYFAGRIADARIYNRPLTAAEIWQQYDPATRFALYRPANLWAFPGLSAVFRRSFSESGARVGSRQAT